MSDEMSLRIRAECNDISLGDESARNNTFVRTYLQKLDERLRAVLLRRLTSTDATKCVSPLIADRDVREQR